MIARILIVEDDGASRELLRYLFTAWGYETLLAADGLAGTELALAESPDLVLCDLRMPRMDGFTVLRHLISAPGWHRVPVIAVTAFSMDGDRESALAAGFSGYFAKPIVPEVFVRKIEAFLPPELRAATAPET